ncbi:MAG: YncE family protein [Firmicutes bacterium]|nr:YncE family protein [Bacillota bacterium]MCM1401245.1 YncE family protein [Bacteroides sp.]MCM1477206.1 YncE family protein [Bacteroides sp.]
MKWDYGEPEDIQASGNGLFIVCEGNFQYSNASLSYYDPATRQVSNEVFQRANGYKLGDVAQSMTIYNGTGWVVVNHSHVIFAIDPVTFREKGRITGLTSPRYIHFVSPQKAYVSQLWDNRIFIINPSTCEITGTILVPGMNSDQGSTEQMIQWGDYVFCNCWSYQRSIIRIDTRTDKVDAELEVGLQPSSIALDRYGKLWALTDGGYDGSPAGHENPSLYCIDANSFTIEKQFQFRMADSPSELQINGTRDTLYWINRDIWRMDVRAQRPPVRPFLSERKTTYYGLTVDPRSGEVYVADAIDYEQQGMIYRYTGNAQPVDSFYVGVTPGAFCWK